jgi:hypothetical protein
VGPSFMSAEAAATPAADVRSARRTDPRGDQRAG